jgi:uncharacterized membrane protein YphA (DoxX/SURF4 family)
MKNVYKYEIYASVVVRIGISLVFLWFGLNQLFNSSSFLGWLPQWAYNFQIKPLTLILLNGLFETSLAILLLLGLFTRASALLLSLHLLPIIFGVGYNDIGVRDFGLLVATFSIFLHGPDIWSLDRKINLHKSFMKLLYIFDK